MAENTGNEWRIGADIGGTFTDVVLEAGQRRHSAKILTSHDAPEEAVLSGVRQVLDEAGVEAGQISQVIHGTTLATNALIERKGARTALISTEGFRDILEMGTESRFDHYDLNLQKPAPLVPRHRRLTVPERMSAKGEVLVPLDEAAVNALVGVLEDQEIESVAVGLLHAYVNPAHEQRIGEILEAELPKMAISLSSEVSPEIREFDRLSTTAANAYVMPKVVPYLNNLQARLSELGIGGPLFMMLSNGGISDLATACRFPVRLIESGPAGGAILAGHIAEQCGLEHVVSFDMGGTTAKICLIDDGVPSTARDLEVAWELRFKRGSGLPLRIPVIEMVEIGAGGGSIAGVTALDLINVGPESAGSDPGPACYGLGGTEPTVTDANVILGRIKPDLFAGGRMKIDARAAAMAVEDHVAEPLSLSPKMGAVGVIEMVDENMANATREHAIERGKTIQNRTMIAFGGCAPLHAARLAQKLGIGRIVVPTGAGVGSAIGFLRAPISFEVVRSRYQHLGAMDVAMVNAMLEEMAAEAASFVRLAAGDGETVESRSAFMRFVGQNHEIDVALPDGQLGQSVGDELRDIFDDTYRAQFGRTVPNVEVEIVSWSVSSRAPQAATGRAGTPNAEPYDGPGENGILWDPSLGEEVDARIVMRQDLHAGSLLTGPAVIVEDETSSVVPSGFRAHINELGYIIMEADASS